MGRGGSRSAKLFADVGLAARARGTGLEPDNTVVWRAPNSGYENHRPVHNPA